VRLVLRACDLYADEHGLRRGGTRAGFLAFARSPAGGNLAMAELVMRHERADLDEPDGADEPTAPPTERERFPY